MPLPQPLIEYPVDGNYVVTAPVLQFDGRDYHAGDVVPANSTLRTMENAGRRIRLLCEQRRLGLLQTPVRASSEGQALGKAAAPEVTKATVPPPDITAMDKVQLRQQCKELGLSPYGNENQLRNRLRTKLG